MPVPVTVINGPNINLLGEREPKIYGTATLADLERACADHGRALGLDVTCRQSSHEGVIIDWIHLARGESEGLVINAGAYAHTSLAIRDALAAYAGPIVEVHLTNVYRREHFRHHSHVAAVATGVICGLGVDGYTLALTALARTLGVSRDHQQQS